MLPKQRASPALTSARDRPTAGSHQQSTNDLERCTNASHKSHGSDVPAASTGSESPSAHETRTMVGARGGIERQETAVRAFRANRSRWQLTVLYADIGSSAAIYRPGVQRMLQAAAAHQFDVVVVRRPAASPDASTISPPSWRPVRCIRRPAHGNGTVRVRRRRPGRHGQSPQHLITCRLQRHRHIRRRRATVSQP